MSNFNFELINNLSDLERNVLSLKFDFILESISNFSEIVLKYLDLFLIAIIFDII